MSLLIRVRSWCLVLLLPLCSAWFDQAACRADDLREKTSLRYVPADASFYGAMLRNREQFDIFLNSNVYGKLKNLPLVTFGLSMWQGQWENPSNDELKVFKELWEHEENQQLVRVFLDAISQEVFVYGDASWGELLVQIQEFQRIARSAQVRAARDGQTDEAAEEELIKAAIERLDQTKVPGTVIGFRISDAAAAETQIARLEKAMNELFAAQEDLQPLKERLKRESIGEASFLTMTLDGTLIPWEQVPDEVQERLGEAGRAAIEKIKLSVCLGVREGYLLLGLGESTELLQRMGQGKLLIDEPKMAPLRKYADRRIVGIGFASDEFMERANSASGQIDDLVSTVETLLPTADLDAETSAAILADAKAFAGELKAYAPKPGAVSSFSFLTERGYESFQYSWTEPKGVDASKPLGILKHVGGSPIGFIAGRSQYHPEVYDWLAKWTARAWQHGRTVISAKMNEEERQRFEQICERAGPLVDRLHETTRKDLIPAFRDGQAAIVLDAQASSNQWHQSLPSTRVKLPMPGVAIVCGVSDVAALKRAGAEYFAVVQEALKVAHELAPNEFPKIELPPPQQETTDAGQIYSYALPEAAGVDQQLAPNVGVSSEAFVMSLFPEQTKRLLQPSDVKKLGPLERSGQPLAAAAYFNVTELMNAITPWLNYSVRIAGQVAGEDGQQARVAAQTVVGNITPILDVLKALGEYASVTYLEDEALVTHSATFYIDAN